MTYAMTHKFYNVKSYVYTTRSRAKLHSHVNDRTMTHTQALQCTPNKDRNVYFRRTLSAYSHFQNLQWQNPDYSYCELPHLFHTQHTYRQVRHKHHWFFVRFLVIRWRVSRFIRHRYVTRWKNYKVRTIKYETIVT